MNLFARLWRSRRGGSVRPRLESLEDRTLLATRLVVPLAQAADLVNSFHDLASAVTAAITVPGDVSQIEPGSAPTVGNITQLFGAQVSGGDVFAGNSFTGTVALGSNAVNLPAAGDQLLNNAFSNGAAATLLRVDRENAPLIQGNTFTDLANGATAVEVDDSLGAVVSGNTLTLSGAASTGVLIQNPASSTGVTVADNRIDSAGQGTGMALAKTTGSSLLANVANNDLVRNLVGLRVTGDGSANADALGTVDAGLGSLGSLGGNDFHGYTGTGGHLAIVTTNAVATTAAVTARGNVFSTATPASVVQAGAGTIDVSMPLAAEAAFADRLFDNFLGRSGTPGPNAELSFWANLTVTRGPGRVAPLFLRQPEALRHLVDVLYLKLLGRQADPAGEAFWVGKLKHGQSLERTLSAFLASAEFGLRANRLVHVSADADTNFIASLYIVLLNRVPSSAEVGVWLAKLPRRGRRRVAEQFTTFPEFRKLFTGVLYAGNATLPATAFVTGLPNLLHRAAPPADAELSVWARSKRDLLGILTRLAWSGEFISNG
jgi:hypothetical protein